MPRGEVFHCDFKPTHYWWEAYQPTAQDPLDVPSSAEASTDVTCPGCHHQAILRHSRDTRRAQGLPVRGTIVKLDLTMTRW